MKDYGLKIKVADLLNNPGNSDNLKFEKKFLKDTDIKLSNKGISGKIYIQGLSKDEILVKIKELNFKVVYQCDKCLDIYEKEYNLKNLEDVRFVNTEQLPIEEKIYDTTFPIDMKNQTIDLSGLVEIIIKNEVPIIKDCGKHKNTIQKDLSESQENFNQTTISFQELLKSKKNVKK